MGTYDYHRAWLNAKMRDRGKKVFIPSVSAHRSKKAAEKQAKLFDGGRVLNTPQWAKKILKGKPYIVTIP